ncbi:hypothetical protein CSKR_110696, partial [Clonorchis sinensis]
KKTFQKSDPCANQPCQNNGTCILVDETGLWIESSLNEPTNVVDYKCLCGNGWTGQNCTEDVDDCIRDPCKNGGVCEDRPDMRYACHCVPGFVGRRCEFVDPCISEPCEHGARCQADILGRFTCHCSTWYHGLRCETEQNPCYPENPCVGPGAVCSVVRSERTVSRVLTPLVIDFNCTCGPGYHGRYCDVKADLCEPNVCQNGGKCIDRGTNSICICPAGYTGSRCEVNSSAEASPSNPRKNVSRENGPARFAVNNIKDISDPNNRCSACPPEFAGDGICQVDCLLNGCAGPRELEDCEPWSKCHDGTEAGTAFPSKQCIEKFHDARCDEQCNNSACHFDGFDCAYNSPYCQETAYCLENYADGICNAVCSGSSCGFDGGDCIPHFELSNASSFAPRSVTPEPTLLLVVLNNSMTTFATHRQAVLFTLASLLQSVVRVWKDRQSGVEMLANLSNTGGVKMVLAVWTDPDNRASRPSCVGANECTTNPIARLSDLELTRYIRAALSTPNNHMPVALKHLVSITDEARLNFFTDSRHTQPGWLRSGEVIGLYVCLCILTTIVILLVIFLVLQRDPWKRHALKRVHTTGIWCPPGPFTFKGIQAISSSYATQSTRPDKLLLKQQDQSLLAAALDPSDPRTSGTTAEYRYRNCQHPLTSLTDPSAESLEKNDFGDKSLLDSFSLGSDSTITHDHGRWYRECSGSAGHTRRCGATSDLNTPPTKHARLNEDPYHLDINADDGKDGLLDGTFKSYQHAEVSSPSIGLPQAALKCPTHGSCSNKTAVSSADPTVDHASEKRNLQRRLRHVLQRQDGLHPLSPNSITLSSNVFQSETQQSHSVHPAGGAEFASRNSQSMEYSSPNPGSDIHRLVDRGTGETLLHLAGRYNGGQDIIFSLPHLMCSDDFGERCACVMWLDHHGRTALTNAAAANALETTAALYQLEREALSQNRTLLIGQSTDQSQLSAKARRRNKQSELRKSTPLIAAVQAGNEELVRHLVDEGYPIVGVDDFGRNVVHWASVTNAIEILQRLAQCKGFHRLVNARDDYDRTPLMLATREGCEQAVQFLLDHKANVLTMDCTDNDALAIAKSKGFDDIERLLLQRHAEDTEETLRLTDNPHLPFPNVTTPPEPTELSEFSELGTHSTGELEQQSAILHPDQYNKAPLETNYRFEKLRPEDSKSPHLTNYLKFAVPKTTSEFMCKLPGREVTKISPK